MQLNQVENKFNDASSAFWTFKHSSDRLSNFDPTRWAKPLSPNWMSFPIACESNVFRRASVFDVTFPQTDKKSL
jgi:hypothetical protein